MRASNKCGNRSLEREGPDVSLDSSNPQSETELPSSQQLMFDVLERQRADFTVSSFPTASLRQDRLRRLLNLLIDHEEKILDAVMSDFGYRSREQSFFVEVVTTAKPIKEAIKRLKTWMKPERRKVDLPFQLTGAKAEIRYQPLGVVGCISPWNFPFNLSFAPIASILAAGNRAMLKPSEVTPASAALMQELICQTFDATEIAVCPGGPEIAQAFSGLPFDHLIYTGGASIAKHVMRAAADNLTPVTLELGGKSPTIIGKGANLRRAADRIVFGKMLNAGQICLAPDNLFVPEDLLETFVSELSEAVRRTAPQTLGTRDFVSIVNQRHADRLKAAIAAAQKAGGRVVEFDWLSERQNPGTNFVPLTLVIEPKGQPSAIDEEIFGPVLTIRPYSDFDEVIAAIQARERPLALYYFGSNKPELRALHDRTHSGGMTINDVIMHYTVDDLPFGGVGQSGMGAYHGFDGFKQFSHARAVYRQTPIDIGAPLRPPYGKAFQRMSRFLLKHG